MYASDFNTGKLDLYIHIFIIFTHSQICICIIICIYIHIISIYIHTHRIDDTGIFTHMYHTNQSSIHGSVNIPIPVPMDPIRGHLYLHPSIHTFPKESRQLELSQQNSCEKGPVVSPRTFPRGSWKPQL